MTENYWLGGYQEAVDRAVAEAAEKSYARRIWDKDATLWKSEPEHVAIIQNALGWLDVARNMLGHVAEIQDFAEVIRSRNYSGACLLGMGGSSLCPEVCATTFGNKTGYPPLVVLDTTDPAAIIAAERKLDLQRTLFIVSSKSGGTIESSSLQKYFYQKLSPLKGERAGENFMAITDPGTSLERLALDQKFTRVFLNPKDIGGRYSALSYFGLVPMALLGIDIAQIRERALAMAERCSASLPAQENPGIVLGAALGVLASQKRQRRDKVTFVLSGEIAALGFWIEQLVAESTGKEGTGIVPIEGETLAPAYPGDRVFVHIGLAGSREADLEQKLKSLANSGHPVIRLELKDKMDLGAEFFRWEFATAVAGIILGINPFDQPNVKESKDNTQRLVGEYLKTERLEGSTPVSVDEKILEDFFKLLRSGNGDYVAILAYVERSQASIERLQSLRHTIRDRFNVATTYGFGPRFLHSTGQLHKGGADNGLFLQITVEDREKLTIPGENYSFSTLKKAQALGDLQALREHGRRVLALQIDGDLHQGLDRLQQTIARG
jgi:glucose-6-phosphate isomerase